MPTSNTTGIAMVTKWSLQFKLILAFLVIVGVLAGASFYQIRAVQHLDSLFAGLTDSDFPRLNLLSDLRRQNTQMRNEILQYQLATAAGKPLNFSDEKNTLNRLLDSLGSSESAYR